MYILFVMREQLKTDSAKVLLLCNSYNTLFRVFLIGGFPATFATLSTIFIPTGRIFMSGPARCLHMKMNLLVPALLLWALCCLSCNNREQHPENGTARELVAAALEVCKNNASVPIDTFGRYSRLAVSMSKAFPEPYTHQQASFYLALYYFNTNDFDTAAQMCNKLLQEIVPASDTAFVLNKANILKGTIYLREGNYKQALDWFFQVLPSVEQTGRTDDMYRLYNNIGVCNRSLQRHNDAIRWYMKNMDIPGDKHIFIKAAGALNIADCYIALEQVDSALKYARIALQLSREHQLLLIQANTLNTIGKVLSAQGKTDEAIRTVQEATQLRKQLGDPYYIISDLLQLSVLYKNKGRFDLGAKMAKEAMLVADTNSISSQRYSIASVLWENYYQNRQYKEAAEQAHEMLSIMATNNETATAAAIAELEVKYETDKKELLIKEQQLALDRKNILLYGSIALLVLLILIVYFAYLSYKNKQTSKLHDAIIREQRQAAKAVILGQEQERSQLSQHLHDSVGQTLSGLKMNLQALDDRIEIREDANIFENSMTLLDDAIDEIRNISHRIQPNNIVRLGLKNALQLLTERIRSDRMQMMLDLDDSIDGIERDTQLIIYRILQESINNVIKHSRARQVQISLQIRAGRLYVAVTDDGIGFDTGELPLQTGIGLNNIYTRIRFLQGNIFIKSQFNQGTRLSFDIPLATA